MGIRAGFIGLGNQGRPIAAHFAPSGYETVVYDLDPAAGAVIAIHSTILPETAVEIARAAAPRGVALPVGGLVSQLVARLYGVEDEGRR